MKAYVLPAAGVLVFMGIVLFISQMGKKKGKAQNNDIKDAENYGTTLSMNTAIPPSPGNHDQQNKLIITQDTKVILNEYMSQIKNQQAVDLSAKKLGDQGFAFISESFAYNSVCLGADFSRNGVGPSGIQHACEFLALSQLKQLILSTNILQDEGAEALAQYLASNTEMELLYLAGNSITDTGVRALSEMLKINQTLRSLDLSSNSVEYEGAVGLGEALSTNQTLKSLYLGDNYLGSMGVQALALGLERNKTLNELVLKQNDIGPSGCEALCKNLQARNFPLVHLDLSNNNLNPQSAQHIADLIRKYPIENLSLSSNDLGDNGMQVIASALKESKSEIQIKSLDVSDNQVTAIGLGFLMEGLHHNKHFKELNVGQNPIGESGARILSQYKYQVQLESLRLGWCKLGPNEGAKAISDLIQYSTNIVNLDLRGNLLQDYGAVQLARAFKSHENANFTELDLGYNEIGDDGACQLASAFKSNPTNSVKVLKINQNHFGRFGQVALAEAMDQVHDMSSGREMTIQF